MSTPTHPELSLENRRAGHAGNLDLKQVEAMKEMWRRLFKLFKQKGEEPVLPKKEVKKSGGLMSSWLSSKEEEENIFLEATADPRWKALSLEKALPLIPGNLLEKTFWNMIATDNPDSAVLRFLRARKWDTEKAYEMLCNTLRWRLYMRVDEIVAQGETGMKDELNKLKAGAGDEFIKQLHSGKATLGGPDKDGHGVCFINVQFHHKDEQRAETVKLLTLYVMETSRLFCAYPTTTACIVFNLENFTLANMDYDFVQFLLGCLEADYPETLGRCIIHKAPWVFNTAWSVIKMWLDDEVAEKITFTKNLDEFTDYINVVNVPSFISKNKKVLTKDEATKCSDPKPGQAKPNESQVEVKEYREAIERYKQATSEWTELPAGKGNDQEDALQRLKRGREYRLARIKAEKYLRGATIYHEKELVRLTDDGRLEIDFGGDTSTKKDVTACV